VFTGVVANISIVARCLMRQVSDVDNILGLLQTEVVQVHAEAYDVALDMSFPKGSSFVLTVLLTARGIALGICSGKRCAE